MFFNQKPLFLIVERNFSGTVLLGVYIKNHFTPQRKHISDSTQKQDMF